jgi:arginyl-tRNA synthetase
MLGMSTFGLLIFLTHLRKEECSFLKKRTKKLLIICARVQIDKSLFASFSSEKEGLPFFCLSGTSLMTHLFATLRERVLAALAADLPDLPPEVLARVEVTPAREVAHGDMATNAAMVVAKPAGRKPQEIAQALVARLQGEADIAEASVAGPGFVNLRLAESTWRAQVPAILAAGESYGESAMGQGVRVNVEYVSANPTGPMHIGHCRGAVVGDALANLLAKAGFDVTKEYYLNDAGNQVLALAWAAYWRYLQALGTPLTEDEYAQMVPGGLQYRGDYLVPVGEALKAAHGDSLAAPGAHVGPVEAWLPIVRDTALAMMMESIREDLALLGVEQEVFSSERALVEAGAADATIETLRARGLIYEGVLEPPKGKTPDDWEPREQTLFRATQFGDDVDRPLRKSDGSNTYFANDIAYHADKVTRGAQVMIDIWGADHGGYVSRMKSAVKALGDGTAAAPTLDIVLCQIVHVLKDGEPVRMSKRAGTFITLRDLLDEVGRDAVRFTMLTRKSDAQMEFDIAQAVAQTRENPVFYVQYAHARCRSVLRAAAEMLGAEAMAAEALQGVALESLSHEAELALIKRLASWPRTVEGAAQAREPHRIAFFLYDLAADFHMLWNRGRDDAALRFLQPEQRSDTLARIALVAATATVIRSGLAVMGVAPVEEMR